MSKIETLFHKKQAFVGYITGGDGGIEYTIECALALIEGGVDLLEIGLPFSDPIADGPIIQKAIQRALLHGTNIETLMEIVRRLRMTTDIPLVLFSYFNPLLKAGFSNFKRLKEAGFDAVLSVDLPPFLAFGETSLYLEELSKAGLQPIFIASPSTPDERLAYISKISKGFLYYACQKGTTGIRSYLPQDLNDHLMRIKQNIYVPVVVGLGIAHRDNVKEVLKEADGFVVGSAFVQLMEQNASPMQIKKFAQQLDARS